MTRKQRSVISRLKNAGGKLPWIDLIGFGLQRTVESLQDRGIISLRGDGENRHWILNEEHLANRDGKVSKAKLEAWCERKGYPLPSYEAYGRQVCAYFSRAPENKTRREFEKELRRAGCQTNPGWCKHKDFTGTEVTNISYFRAYGWNA